MKRNLYMVLFLMAVLVTPTLAGNPQTQPVKITDYNNFSIAGVLEENIGKKIEVTLSSGATFSGKLVGVGAQAIHLGELSGREFFDAAIEKSAIVAVVLRAKDR